MRARGRPRPSALHVHTLPSPSTDAGAGTEMMPDGHVGNPSAFCRLGPRKSAWDIPAGQRQEPPSAHWFIPQAHRLPASGDGGKAQQGQACHSEAKSWRGFSTSRLLGRLPRPHTPSVLSRSALPQSPHQNPRFLGKQSDYRTRCFWTWEFANPFCIFGVQALPLGTGTLLFAALVPISVC